MLDRQSQDVNDCGLNFLFVFYLHHHDQLLEHGLRKRKTILLNLLVLLLYEAVSQEEECAFSHVPVRMLKILQGLAGEPSTLGLNEH